MMWITITELTFMFHGRLSLYLLLFLCVPSIYSLQQARTKFRPYMVPLATFGIGSWWVQKKYVQHTEKIHKKKQEEILKLEAERNHLEYQEHVRRWYEKWEQIDEFKK